MFYCENHFLYCDLQSNWSISTLGEIQWLQDFMETIESPLKYTSK